MNYDFVEIGTSDHTTLIQSCKSDSVGLSVEPLKIYLDRLPSKPNCTKVNCAVSDRDGSVDIFYVPLDKLETLSEKYDHVGWIRGSNSIGRAHPYVLKWLRKRDLDPKNFIISEKVPVVSFQTLALKYDIQKVRTLKIDTEGYDCVILGDYAELCTKQPQIKAKTIIFEAGLTNALKVMKCINLFESMGYECVELGWDAVLKQRMLYL